MCKCMHMRMRVYIHLCDVHSHAHVYEGINVLEIQFLHVRIYTHCQLALAIAGAIDLHCANACARWLRLYLYTCIRTYVRTGNALPATNIRDRDVYAHARTAREPKKLKTTHTVVYAGCCPPAHAASNSTSDTEEILPPPLLPMHTAGTNV